MSEEIMSLKGTNGIIKVYEDRAIVSRNTINGLIYQGLKGDKVFFYNTLSGIEYKKPTFLANGYIKFITGGTNERNPRPGLFGISDTKSLKDPNTLLLTYSENNLKKSNDIYEYIIKQINQNKGGTIIQNNISNADEILKYKKLLDEGIITQEEFEKKKKELLN